MDVETQKSARVGGEKDSGGSPLWAPDGKVLAFGGNQGGKTGLFVAHQDGSEVISLAPTTGTNSPLPGSGREMTWSPDGKQIAGIWSTPSALSAEASGDPMVISRYL